MYGLKLRHYSLPAALKVRTYSDVSPEARESKARAFTFLQDLRASGPTDPSLIPTATGSIDRILFTIPSYAADDTADSHALAIVYQDLIAKLPKRTRFIVLTHGSVQNTVQKWLTDAGHVDSDVVIANEDLNFSIWAEDGYVIATDAQQKATYFVQPYTFPRYGDALIAPMISNATDLKDTQAPLIFQGGNMLIGDDFFFIGADYPAETLRYVGDVLIPQSGETKRQAVHRAYLEYLDHHRTLQYVGSTIAVPTEQSRKFKLDGHEWTETIYFGNGRGTVEPLFHLDMFVTLIGKRDDGKFHLFVADPSLAAEILHVSLWPTAMQDVFDNIANGLGTLGFVVHRNPLPLVYMDDPENKQRTWYFATANNALVENIDGGTKTVWLPTYGYGAWQALKATDAANAEAWRALGFDAIMLGDFHPFAENLGAVHCIKKYLQRG